MTLKRYSPLNYPLFILLINIAALFATISGCSTFKTFEGKTFTGSTNIYTSRIFASEKALEYRAEFSRLENQKSWIFDFPLIGMASGSAAALLYGAPVDLISGIGLSAATTAGVRTYTNNNGKAGYFLLAEEASRCVFQKSIIFLNMQDKIQIISAREKIIEIIKEASPILSNLEDNLKAKEALSTAISIGLKSEKIAKTALDRIDDAPTHIIETIYQIEMKLHQLIRNSIPDVKNIVDTISTSTKSLISIEDANKKISADTDRLQILKSEASKEISHQKQLVKPAKLKTLEEAEKAIKMANELSFQIAIISEFASQYIEAFITIENCTTKL